MSFRPSQETRYAWLEMIGNLVGLVLVLIGAGVYLASYIRTGEGHAEPLLFSTGALFFFGGAAGGVLGWFRRPPDPPSKEQV